MTTPRPGATPVPEERSLNRQLVLDEDEYTAALSHIIARDFFPSLVHLDATNDYLDALRTQDPHLINASVRRLEEINTPAHRRAHYQTPSETPYGAGPSETPLRTPRDGEGRPAKRARYDIDMSLDSFQARYTSEDNSSFTHILDEENRQKREKWAWAWDAQKRVEGQRDRMIQAREKMLIEGPAAAGVREKFRIEAPKHAGLLTDGSEKEEAEEDGKEEAGEDVKGKELTILSNESEIDVLAPTKDTRPAGVHGWKFKTRNSLMFPPDADESPYHPTSKNDTKADPKVIVHTGTRLPDQTPTSSTLSEPPSPTRSRIDAAIMGTPYRPRSPKINEFSLVPNLPSPTPSELGPKAVKQLMTWGTLNATPRIISSDEPLPPPSTPFHISAPSSREKISHKLSSDASKSLRAKAGLLGLGPVGRTAGISRTPAANRGSMGPPSWTPRRSDAGNLTPAAKRLLDRTTMGTVASRRAEAMERMARWDGSKQSGERDLNRVRWTPTPGASR